MNLTLHSLCSQAYKQVVYLRVGNHKDISCSLEEGKQLLQLPS